MQRADEPTAPIKRDELLGLLNTMTPAEQQSITTRASTAAIEAELARQLALDTSDNAAPSTEPAPEAETLAAPPGTDAPNTAAIAPAARLFPDDIDWDQFLSAALTALVTPRLVQPSLPAIPKLPSAAERAQPKRKHGRPLSQVAALLAPHEPARFPRATRPPVMRAKTQTELKTLTIPEIKAKQAVADVRARLDCHDDRHAERALLTERPAFPTLSAHVVAQLSGEEIAMLPMEMRLLLPELPAQPVPAHVDTAPAIRARALATKTLPPLARAAHPASTLTLPLAAIIASVAAIVAGVCAVSLL
jgi:hypothetical protein